MGSHISFIPTPFEDIDVFFELAPVSYADVVYDMGSGDGRLLFAALQKGAGRAVGVELNPELILKAREKAMEEGLGDKVTFLEADVMEVDLSPATLVLCYLTRSASAPLKPKFDAELKPGTRVVTESFPVHGWTAVEVKARGYRTFYSYQMPGAEPIPPDAPDGLAENSIEATMARLKEKLLGITSDALDTREVISPRELRPFPLKVN
jgi:SAM-dependent methyltransferase